jgi:hypothetical protein
MSKFQETVLSGDSDSKSELFTSVELDINSFQSKKFDNSNLTSTKDGNQMRSFCPHQLIQLMLYRSIGAGIKTKR